MMMQEIITYLIIAVVAGLLIYRGVKFVTGKGKSGCSCGCGGCSSSGCEMEDKTELSQ